jgi:FOG: WD40 repeat
MTRHCKFTAWGLYLHPLYSIIRKQFEADIPRWVAQVPWVDIEWGAALQVLEGHSYHVKSVVFSPDSCLLASTGSHEHTILLWDTATGVLQQTLEGHSHEVDSLAFSPDGRLACGATNGTVRL